MPRFFTIDDSIILEVSGPDAARYLQARLSNDVKALSPCSNQIGPGILAAMLSPQGRTEGLFVVTMISESRFLLHADGGSREDLLTAFRRYIVADRVEVQDKSQSLSIVHLFGEDVSSFLQQHLSLEALPETHYQGLYSSNTYIIARKRSHSLGLDIIAEKPLLTLLTQSIAQKFGTDPLSAAEQETARICAGIPAFPKEINNERLFSESGISSAISQKKGCYVGQEVIEKISARGKPPRILRFAVCSDLKQPPKIGDPVVISNPSTDEVSTIGKVLSACYDPCNDRCAMFIDVRNDAHIDTSTLCIDDKPLTLLALGIE